MNRRLLLRGASTAVTLCAMLIGCGQNKSAEVRSINGPTKSYESSGIVTKIDSENGRVVLDHEKIGDWMEPMTMPFPVSDPALLDGVESGKRYAFTVVVGGEDNTEYMITKLTPAH
jgi:Cu/Ag efflux protein CusF